MSNICPKRRHASRPGAKFCGKCGQALPSAPTIPPAAHPMSVAKPISRNPMLIIGDVIINARWQTEVPRP